MKIKLDDGAFVPVRAHETDAGLDLRTPKGFTIFPHDSAVTDTGVHVQLPHGTYGKLESKSGLNVKRDIVDRVKIGKLNYHKSDIDWKDFGKMAESACQKLGLDYYIKDNLRAEMEE